MDTRCCTCWQKKYLVLLLLISHVLLVRPAAAQLPEGWSSLPPAEFLEVADATLQSNLVVSDEIKDAIDAHAAALLAQSGVARHASFRTLLRLRRLAKNHLNDEAKAFVITELQERSENLANLDFDELKARCLLTEWCVAKENRDALREANSRLLADWLANRKVQGLLRFQELKGFCLQAGQYATADQRDDVRTKSAQLVAEWVKAQTELTSLSLPELTFCCRHLCHFDYYTRSFKVTWRGKIAAPRTGEYRFSTSPYDINYEHPGDYHRQAMRVRINGQRVLNATPEEWSHQGHPVFLTAGESVPLEVAYEFEIAKQGTTTPDEPIQLDRSPAVVLSWRGPGFAQQVIPTQAFPGGLDAEYAIRFRGGQKSDQRRQLHFARTEPNIDHVWIGGDNFLCFYPKIRDQLCAEVWQRVMAPGYWEACNANALTPPAKNDPTARETRTHWLLKESTYAAFLTANQRRQFLTTLVHYPAIVQQMSFGKAYAVYTRFWHGAEEEALAVMAQWLRLHPEPTTKLSSSEQGFYLANRWRYRQLTIPAMLLCNDHIHLLEEGCLELENGCCCLPVAYACAYAHLQQGTIKEWIAELDARLADASLTGDRRVNWLLARAMAEEIRGGAYSPFSMRPEEYWRGLPWLEEAILVAETESVRFRAEMERISRFAALSRYDKVEVELARLQGRQLDAKSRENTRRMLKRVQRFQDRQQQQIDLRNQERAEAYQRIIARRKGQSEKP